MLDWLLVSFLWLFVTSGSDTLEEQEFIDLSKFDYDLMSMPNQKFKLIALVKIPDVKMELKDKFFQYTGWSLIKCYDDDLVNAYIEMEYKDTRVSFPFNMSCNRGQYLKNTFIVLDIETHPNIKDISISWRPPSTDIDYYLVIVMGSSRVNTIKILRETSYQVKDLKEKSWYQICIASINKIWRTSKFNCKKSLTDFSTTGPVTNVTVTTESDRVSISWSRPEYEYDIPQGYIIYLQGRTNQMCRLYIIKRQPDIYPLSQYSCVNTETITSSLSSLEIKDLPPNSEFTIEISSFNWNKKPAITHLTIKTKEEGSGPVQNLKVDPDRDPHYIHISFEAPINPAAIILNQRMKIVNTCTSSNDIGEEYFHTTYCNISKYNLKKCNSSVSEMAPLIKWKNKRMVSKTGSMAFDYSTDHQSSWTVNTKFISSDSLTISLGGLKEDKCENFGFIFEIKDEKNHSNCLTSVITSFDCEPVNTEINETHNCAEKRSTCEFFISGIPLYVHSYSIKVRKVTSKNRQLNEPIRTGGIKDCFTDCYNKGRHYDGIRSITKNGQVCTTWTNKEYSPHRREQSNICSSVNVPYPVCHHDNLVLECDVPECSHHSAGTGCVDNVTKTDKMQYMIIEWSPPPIMKNTIGYVIVLHNRDHFCEEGKIQLCENCEYKTKVISEMKRFLLPCNLILIDFTISLKVNFTGLYQDQTYYVYIAPILSTSEIGEMRNITVVTKPGIPHIPNGIRCLALKLYYLKCDWNKNVATRTNGPPEDYVAILKKKDSKTIISATVNSNSVGFGDLKPCSEYCFTLKSINNAGDSDYTKELCFFTLAPKIKGVGLNDLPSESMRGQSLSWTYLGSDDCSKSYSVQYHVKYLSQETFDTFTSRTSVKLIDLKPNVIYTVQVKAKVQIMTVNKILSGEFSASKEFYTGTLQPTLSYYHQNLDHTNKVLNISWGIEEKLQESIFVYIIQVRNFIKHCMYSVRLDCRACREPWSLKNLNHKHYKTLKNLTVCTNSLNQTFDANQISFYYTFRAEKVFNDFSVDIYGIDLMGIHLLKWKNFSVTPGASFPWLIVLIVVIVFFLFFGILVLITWKRNPLRLHMRKYDVNRESYLMISADESEILNSKIIISAFPTYYQKVRKYRSIQLRKQYQKLSRESKAQEAALDLTAYVSKDLENSKKNLIAGIFPYDQTRVKIGQRKPPQDYINASYIPFKNNEEQIEYIAAQGPIEDTLADFWEMIWENDINCIMMLTRMSEKDKCKCLQYWPKVAEENATYGEDSQFVVCLVKEETKKEYTERELVLENKNTKVCRKIVQLHMHTWSDHSAPNLCHFDKFLFRFHEITDEDASIPYLVHCTAGVGATGTFICIDQIIKQLVSGIQMISIYNIVLKLRRFRSFMVESQSQYIFIHKYLNHFLSKYMKIEDDDNCDYDY